MIWIHYNFLSVTYTDYHFDVYIKGVSDLVPPWAIKISRLALLLLPPTSDGFTIDRWGDIDRLRVAGHCGSSGRASTLHLQAPLTYVIANATTTSPLVVGATTNCPLIALGRLSMPFHRREPLHCALEPSARAHWRPHVVALMESHTISSCDEEEVATMTNIDLVWPRIEVLQIANSFCNKRGSASTNFSSLHQSRMSCRIFWFPVWEKLYLVTLIFYITFNLIPSLSAFTQFPNFSISLF